MEDVLADEIDAVAGGLVDEPDVEVPVLAHGVEDLQDVVGLEMGQVEDGNAGLDVFYCWELFDGRAGF